MSRYIKTSDLHKSFFEYKDRNGKIQTIPNRDCDNRPITISIEEIKRAITKTPTADVEPVRHGRWQHGVDGADYAFCTACKRRMSAFLYGYGYCPLCGARMDGKENEQ